MLTIIFLFLVLLQLGLSKDGEFFHKPSTNDIEETLEREPGLWRSMWILDRELYLENNKEPIFDRIVVRLKSNRAIEILKPSKRKLIGVCKPPPPPPINKALLKYGEVYLFDGGNFDENLKKLAEIFPGLKEKKKVNKPPLEGAFSLGVVNDLVRDIKIETRESASQRFIHEALIEWGNIDIYSVMPAMGKILGYHISKAGFPLGNKEIGTFRMRFNINRPMVSNEFLAFQ